MGMPRVSTLPSIFLIMLVPLLIFPGTWRDGEVVSSMDHLSVHSVFQQEPGGSVRHSALSDPALQFSTFQKRTLEALGSGRAPLWNPDIYAGAPLLGNGQSRPFSPVTLLHLLLGERWAQNVGVWWLLVWPAVGSFLLMRKMGLSSSAALCGAMAVPTLPFLQVWLLHPHASTYVWLPWMLLCVESMGARGSPQALAICAFGLMTGGHPETAFHVLLFVGGWGLWRRRFWTVVFSVGMGLLMSAAIWLPVLENVVGSATLEAHGGNRILLPQLLDLVWPNLYGHPALEGYSGSGVWADGVLSPGVAVVLLAFGAWKHRTGRVFLWIPLVCIGVSLVGLPLANHARMASMSVFFLALACGFGVSRFSPRIQAILACVIVLSGLHARRHDQASLPLQQHSPEPAPWALELANQVGDQGRVLALGTSIQPNTGALAGLRVLRGYDLPVSKDWEAFAAELDPRLQRPDFPVSEYQARNAGPIAFAGVRYVISEERIEGLEVVDVGESPVHVHRLSEPGHRAWLAQGARAVRGQSAALRAIVQDPLARSRPPVEGLPRGWEGRSYTALEVVEERPERVRVPFSTDTEKILVLADSWHSGWSAEVDGQERPLLRVGGYFKGVVVGPGDKEAVFSYSPVGWRLGRLFSLLAWLGWSLWLLWRFVPVKARSS